MNASHGLEINKFALRIVLTILIVCLAYIAISSQRRQPVQSAAVVAMQNQLQSDEGLPERTLLQLLAQPDHFVRDSLALLSGQVQDSVDAEIALQQYFFNWQQQQPSYASVSLQLARCNPKLCIVSLVDVSALTPTQQQQLASSLQFSSAIPTSAPPLGGLLTSGERTVYRQILPLHPKFAERDLAGNAAQ